MGIPTYFKNPFISSTELYRTFEIFKRINLNMLYVVPFDRIYLRTKGHIKKIQIAEADYRYPGILYRSELDPENTTVKKEFCIFDGTHRVHKMISEGKTSSVFYIIEPDIFDGLKHHGYLPNSFRTTGCIGCGE
tara:strand:- start:10 stop:411 length:402 start_codon:yes stop_codon:yes gene_type:complete